MAPLPKCANHVRQDSTATCRHQCPKRPVPHGFYFVVWRSSASGRLKRKRQKTNERKSRHLCQSFPEQNRPCHRHARGENRGRQRGNDAIIHFRVRWHHAHRQVGCSPALARHFLTVRRAVCLSLKGRRRNRISNMPDVRPAAHPTALRFAVCRGPSQQRHRRHHQHDRQQQALPPR